MRALAVEAREEAKKAAKPRQAQMTACAMTPTHTQLLELGREKERSGKGRAPAGEGWGRAMCPDTEKAAQVARLSAMDVHDEWALQKYTSHEARRSADGHQAIVTSSPVRVL
jgi:hypothetical protein